MVREIADLESVSQFLDAVLAGAVIAVVIGIALLVAYRHYPEKFPRTLTARAIRFRAFLLIVGGVALTVWDTLR